MVSDHWFDKMQVQIKFVLQSVDIENPDQGNALRAIDGISDLVTKLDDELLILRDECKKEITDKPFKKQQEIEQNYERLADKIHQFKVNLQS